MEYYGGILNRSFIVLVSDSLIFGGKVRGAIAAGVSRGYSSEKLDDPYFYANPKLLESYLEVADIQPNLLDVNHVNFIIKRSDISEITYTPEKKWGMGDVVHTGRVFIKLKKGKQKELILLGKPDVVDVKEKLKIISDE